ncbi:Phospholipase D active site motif domain protein [Synechococcus sp. PCC 7335]|uniref:phospholipase D-like domain-containing protein n=1 Tax=Synechococcus sp. (strain ATCC 29403 / PCC 7335) TaxID=91464 RepID=UPI00017EC001|nr:phospholipase D-like domain-containing protein [Synechococcus sp. PCC 7335]EDX85514.1 Phospholipase D active site motif domain protein [Synechococcus sp. PCC 7335]
MNQGFLRDRRHQLLSLLILLLASSSLWRLWASNRGLQPLVEPLPQDPYIQVFFNQSEANVYTEPYRQIERHGDNIEALIITAIEQSTQTVDIAVQALNLPQIAQALVDSSRRGVTVRLILENQYAKLEAEQLEALTLIKDAQILRIDDTADGSKGSGLMHHKFLVIDGRWVLTGSANLTFSGVHGDANEPDSRGNANVFLKIDSRAIALQFTDEFNLMWGDGPSGNLDSQFGLQKPPRSEQVTELSTGTITVQFSPTTSKVPWEKSVNGLISRTLAQSNSSIDLALFVFSEQRIANQLEYKVKTGTALRLLIDPGFVYRNYSEALDMLGISLPDHRCKIEAQNRPWQTPITAVGSPRLLEGDKLHHKFAIIDDTTVIVGSQNWSHAANAKNDETLLVIRNPTVAAHFNREFERLYRQPYLGNTPLLQRKIEESKQKCPML